MWFYPIPNAKQFSLYSLYQKAILINAASFAVLAGLGLLGFVVLLIMGPGKATPAPVSQKKDKEE